MDYRLGLMCGIDLPIPSLQLLLHQPKIKEIAMIGEEEFFIGVQCLCIDKKNITKDERVLSEISNFQVFMTMMMDKESASRKKSVQQVLTLLFPDTQTLFTPNGCIFKTGDQVTVVDDNNFEELQSLLKWTFCLNKKSDELPEYNPKGKKAQEIADKIMRGRARVAKIKGQDKESIFTKYLSILTVGLNSMSLNELMELTMFQLYDLMERYQLYIAWDIDLRSRMAGAKPEKSPDNWMKNLYKDN